MWQVAEATGWSVRHILYGVNYQTLIMMLSDAPRYIKVKTKNEIENQPPEAVDEESAIAEAKKLLEFFPSELK